MDAAKAREEIVGVETLPGFTAEPFGFPLRPVGNTIIVYLQRLRGEKKRRTLGKMIVKSTLKSIGQFAPPFARSLAPHYSLR